MRLLTYFDRHYRPTHPLRISTVDGYRRACRLLDVDLKAITSSHVARFASESLSSGQSPHTIRGRVAVIMSVWAHAHAAGQAPPPDRPVIPRCPRKIIRATPEHDIGRLVSHCLDLRGKLRRTSIPRGIFWASFVAVSYETALRTSDVRQLRYDPRGAWYIRQKKTGRPVTVDVGPVTLRLLEELSRSSPRLFDLPWRREAFYRGLKRIGREIGIDVFPQQLRQSAASEAERLKPGSAWILLGHGSAATTQKWYIDAAHAYADLPRPRISWETISAPKRPETMPPKNS